jgi:hypothetical protein
MVKNWDRDRLVIYSVHWSDGKVTSADMFPESVPKWAWDSIALERKKMPLLNIDKITDPSGNIVWPQEAARKPTIGDMLWELYVGAIGWFWIAGIVVAFMQLARAVFFKGSWSWFLGAVAVTWVLWKLSLYYHLEKQKKLDRAAMFQRPQ